MPAGRPPALASADFGVRSHAVGHKAPALCTAAHNRRIAGLRRSRRTSLLRGLAGPLHRLENRQAPSDPQRMGRLHNPHFGRQPPQLRQPIRDASYQRHAQLRLRSTSNRAENSSDRRRLRSNTRHNAYQQMGEPRLHLRPHGATAARRRCRRAAVRLGRDVFRRGLHAPVGWGLQAQSSAGAGGGANDHVSDPRLKSACVAQIASKDECPTQRKSYRAIQRWDFRRRAQFRPDIGGQQPPPKRAAPACSRVACEIDECCGQRPCPNPSGLRIALELEGLGYIYPINRDQGFMPMLRAKDLARLLFAALMELSLLALGCCGSRSVSGTYVTANSNSVSMLQLVETEDHRVTGSLQGLLLGGNGQTAAQSIQVAGSVDGDNLVLSNVARWYEGSVNMTGKVTPNGISLTVATSAGPSTYEMQEASVEDYAKRCADLRQHGELIQAEIARQQAAAQALAQNNARRDDALSLAQELEQTAQNDALATPEVNAATAQFASYSERMRSLGEERAREGDTVQGSQLEVGINQIDIGRSQIRTQIEQSATHFAQHWQALSARKAAADAWCSQANDPTCYRLGTAWSLYASNARPLVQAYQNAETTFQRNQ